MAVLDAPEDAPPMGYQSIRREDGDEDEDRFWPVWAPVCALSVSMIATAYHHRVAIWQLGGGGASGVARMLPEGHHSSVYELQLISGAGESQRLLASACRSRIYLWDPEANTRLSELSLPGMVYQGMADLGGRRLLTTLSDADSGYLRMWDAATGAQLAALSMEKMAVRGCVCALPEGRTAVSCVDNKMRFYAWDEGQQALRECGAPIPTPGGVYGAIVDADQGREGLLTMIGAHSMYWQPWCVIAAAGGSSSGAGGGGGGGGSGELDGGWRQWDAPVGEVWGLMVVRGPAT